MKNEYLKSLTWLRAFAAFFVVVSHSIRTSEVKYAPLDEESYFLPLSLLDLGTFGVYLFFALSGCTLYLSNENKLGSPIQYRSFFIKRFFRIWPAFAVSIIVCLLFIEFFKCFYIGDETLWIAQFLHKYNFLDIFKYLSLTFNLTGPSDLFQSPYWSLPIEFQYYLLLPFCIFFMKLKRGLLITPILFGGFLYMIYREKTFDVDRYEIFKMGYSFFGGVFLAALYNLRGLKISSHYSVVFFFFIILSVGLVRTGFLNIPDNIPFISDKWNFYGLCALFSVFLALNMKPIENDNIITRFLSEYGEISYSIYLFHMIFVGLAALAVVNFQIYGDNQKLFFVLFVSLIGSFIFSKFSYKYIELPSIYWGRKFSKPNKPI